MSNVVIDKSAIVGDVTVRLENEYDMHYVPYGLFVDNRRD